MSTLINDDEVEEHDDSDSLLMSDHDTCINRHGPCSEYAHRHVYRSQNNNESPISPSCH